MTIKQLLESNNLLTKDIIRVNYHLGLFSKKLDYFKMRASLPVDMTNDELLDYILDIYKKCDFENPEYNSHIDLEMTRIGLNTDIFPGPHTCDKWNNGMFEDDGFGFGNEITSIYDDYMDLDDDFGKTL